MRALFLACLSLLAGCARSHTLEGDGGAPMARDAAPPAAFGLVTRTCGPDDGLAWAILLTQAPVTCDTMEAPPGTSLAFLISGEVTAGGSFSVDGTFRGAAVARCEGGTMSCVTATRGSVQIERLREGSEIVLSWSLVLMDGSTDQGRARLTQFCPFDGPCG